MSNIDNEIKQNKTPYDYYGTGFRVQILNPRFIKVLGEWALDIDYQKLDNEIYRLIATKKAPITGNELRFIRLMSEMTQEQFGERFNVRHAAVSKWEKTKDEFTKMEWHTEKEIRLFMIDELFDNPVRFVEFWRKLIDEPIKKKTPIMKVDSKELLRT